MKHLEEASSSDSDNGDHDASSDEASSIMEGNEIDDIPDTKKNASSSNEDESSSSFSSKDNNFVSRNVRAKNTDDISSSSDDEEEDDEVNNSQSSDSGSDDDSDSDPDMSLHERIKRREEKGITFRKPTERKQEALKIATQRLATLKEENKKDSKNRKSLSTGNDNSDDNKDQKTKKKNKSKNKPAEVSSKRSDFYRRGPYKLNQNGVGVEIGAHRYKPMDPRVSSLSGHFNEEQFFTNYSFLEEKRNQEIGQLRKRVAAHRATGDKGRRMRRKFHMDVNNPSSLEEDEARLAALIQERADVERRKIEIAAKRSVKRKIREGVESGKTGAYFLKRKERKRLELEAKLEEIQKRGGKKALEKMLAKKRRKNKSRDARMFAK